MTALLFGYSIVCVITPFPQTWHIATSFERLIVQLWPSTVFAAFQLAGTAQVFGERPIKWSVYQQKATRAPGNHFAISLIGEKSTVTRPELPQDAPLVVI